MNPIISIWTQPKKTVQYMIDHKSMRYALLLVLLAAFSSGIMSLADTGIFGSLSLPAILTISIGSTLLFSIPAWYINAIIYTWIGKKLGGTGNWREMCQVVAAGMIPMIWTMPIGIIAVIIYGRTLFATPGVFEITNMSNGIYLLHSIILIAIGIFGTVILSQGIGLVHNFSSWRGFGTVMIFAGILFVLVFIILMVVVLSFL